MLVRLRDLSRVLQISQSSALLSSPVLCMGASEELHALLAEKGVRCTDGSAQDFVRWVCDHVANHHLGQDKSGLAGEASMAKRLATAEARLEQNLRMRQSLQEECSKAEARAERLRAARPIAATADCASARSRATLGTNTASCVTCRSAPL